MSPRSSMVVLVALIAVAACAKKSPEEKAEDTAKATADREQKEEKSLACEQSRYRVLLTKEIAWIDRRVGDLKEAAASSEGSLRAEKESDILAARSWRARLEQDVELIDHPPPGIEWPALKASIERDLNENRPPSMPRSFEKPYGI